MITVEKVNEIILKHLTGLDDWDLVKVDRASTEIVEYIINKLAKSKSQVRRLNQQLGVKNELQTD